VVRNLGAYSGTAGDWTVLVDGSGVTVSAVEGDTGKATLHLGTAISKGKHDVVVILKGAKKAFSGKLVVP
jgi:archaellum component FlaG (FlaF/FlaG flagellin family)